MVGKRIKELRKERGLSLKDLSKRIDISISFLSDIENERSNPSLDRLKDIAKGLDTTVSYLLGESDNIVFDDNIYKVLSNPYMQEIINELKDFDSWSEEDRQEVLAYLRAKNLVRKSKDSK
ncbi:helix-turn-helix domain-containing protein [Paramaledivibacter caminithermalis]|jgi:transcriptional regulator with XRE-family HTH domain|uniref:DNA-binding transcriptional regulator, XRE-family HTH domain n=1 Tax=Paramaledivibacter caminithermalis (strain DSM 15212 / CIP 107654 / DViRD3) TaxID=1121301 RepID=A0A1M6NBG5_PARC5|nr:helix-turn-helix transcriptional regulator [Paramaledivibacter caminithermalis]SHJ92886.1 DNA-binding transcriptional regulator, XRE-family HTH domain [Paramaledivibacter caminithermalis DSM 15212]